jgi:hypothetical protein
MERRRSEVLRRRATQGRIRPQDELQGERRRSDGFPGPVRGDRARFEFRAAGGTWTALSGTALQFPFISPGYHSYEVRVVPSLGPAGSSRRLEMYVHPPWYRQFATSFGFWPSGS